MKSRILHVDDVPFTPVAHGEKFACEIAEVGRALQSRKLGFNITVIPPGKRSFPYHAHRANEEMFFVLEGEGTARIAGQMHRIRAGDFISLPPGKDSAHQILNDSASPLRYLAVSTMELPEIVEYPDSGKIAATAGSFPSQPPNVDSVRLVARIRDGVDYWDGE